MKFKNVILSLAAASSLWACSDIDENNRYITVDNVDPQRSIIIEDFTGQNCVNCPAAHRDLEKLVEQYGDAVIPVSIHAGSFGIAADYTRYTGLMQPEGNTYNDAWGINEWPKGVINRQSGPIDRDAWAKAVRDIIGTPTPLDIDLEASCPDGASEISIKLTLRPAEDIAGNLQLWILEDGIVARQQDIDLGRIDDYVHNHVYRAAVNGVGGQPVDLAAHLHMDATFTQPLRATATETWVPANLSVVAFVYNDRGVVQAAKAKVNTNI